MQPEDVVGPEEAPGKGMRHARVERGKVGELVVVCRPRAAARLEDIISRWSRETRGATYKVVGDVGEMKEDGHGVDQDEVGDSWREKW